MSQTLFLTRQVALTASGQWHSTWQSSSSMKAFPGFCQHRWSQTSFWAEGVFPLEPRRAQATGGHSMPHSRATSFWLKERVPACWLDTTIWLHSIQSPGGLGVTAWPPALQFSSDMNSISRSSAFSELMACGHGCSRLNHGLFCWPDWHGESYTLAMTCSLLCISALKSASIALKPGFPLKQLKACFLFWNLILWTEINQSSQIMQEH